MIGQELRFQLLWKQFFGAQRTGKRIKALLIDMPYFMEDNFGQFIRSTGRALRIKAILVKLDRVFIDGLSPGRMGERRLLAGVDNLQFWIVEDLQQFFALSL